VTEIDFARFFSMAAFEGLRILRRHAVYSPDVPIIKLGALIARVEADATALDVEAAYALSAIVPNVVSPEDGTAFYRACIEAVTISKRPVWAKIMLLGRRKFVQKLSRDEMQCFREAGLLIDPPTPDVIEWWDRVNGNTRLAGEQIKLERARAAERLSLEHESKRLAALGIPHKPQWISIEDNTAGYDVLSYDLGPVEPVNRLIEVKSTIASPLRFFLTRNEWEKASEFGQAYHFHIWDLQAQPPRQYQRTAADIAPHAPTDNERGEWKNAEIPVIQ
jgi:hypothetical protein